MRKRLIALLVITPLLLSSQLSTSHAAAKAGAKCTKMGIPYVMQEAQKAYPKQSVHPDYKKAIVFTRS